MALDWNRIIAISDDGTVDSFGIERIILVTGQKGDKGDSGDGTAVWGEITGNISSQTDLALTLASKADASETYTKSDINSLLNNKQNKLTFDTVPTSGSTNPVTSGGVYNAIANSGGGGGGTADSVAWGNITGTLSNQTDLSTALSGKQDALTFDTAPTASSTNPVTSGGVKTALDAKANLKSPTFTGTPKAPTATAGTSNTQIATTAFVQTAIANAGGGGGTADSVAWGNITGTLSSQTDLSTALSEKQNTLTFDSTPTVNSTNPVTSGGIKTVLDAKAPLASPVFTGTPQAPTATAGTNNKQIATTAFVQTAVDNKAVSWGNITGTLSNQTDLSTALSGKQDTLTFDTTPTANSTKPVTSGGVKTALDAKAPLASPVFTGTPQAPTAAAGTNTKQIATTAFVKNAVDTGVAGKADTSAVYTKTQTDSLIDGLQDQIDNLNSFEVHICTSGEYDSTTKIPTVSNPLTDTFYLVPSGTGNDVYDEWIYINSAWEKFGSSRIDISNYYTKPETDELLDDKADVADVFTKEEAETLFSPVSDSASGNVVTIPDGGENIQLKAHTVTFEPAQSGSGTPSSSNIRPITGYSGATIYHSGATTSNPDTHTIDFIDSEAENLIYMANTGGSGRGLRWRFSEGIIKIGGTYNSSSEPAIDGADIYYDNVTVSFGFEVQAGTYKFTGLPNDTKGVTLEFIVYSGNSYSISNNGVDSGSGVYITAYDDIKCYININIPSGTDFGFSESLLYHITPVLQEIVGGFYGGTLDVFNGELTITKGCIDSYNGETLPGAWISDRAVYSAGVTPPTGAKVVYDLTTPKTYNVESVKLSTLLGTNNFWCNIGNTSITYYVNLPLFIQKITGGGGGGTADSVAWGSITGILSNQTDLSTALSNKQNTLTFDTTPTANSTNPVTSGGVYNAIANSCGSVAWGNITGTLSSQTDLSTALSGKQDALTFDSTPTASSTNPVTSGGVKTALDAKANLKSPTLTGTPKAPTAAAGTNTTQIATTAFVQTAMANAVIDATPITKVEGNAMLDVSGLSEKIGSVEVWRYPKQNGYGTPSSSNIRPFILETNVSVQVLYDSEAYTSNTVIATISGYGYYLSTKTGELSYPYGHIASYNGETLTGMWWSDRDEYNANSSPTIGAEVVYELPIRTLIGKYNFSESVIGFINNNITDSYKYISFNEAGRIGYIVGDAYIIAECVKPIWGSISGTLSDQTDLQAALSEKQNTLTFDDTPTANSNNPVTSDGIKKAIDTKADALTNTVSGDPAVLPNSANAPVEDLTVSINFIQEGEGDPSPENIRPIRGWTGVNINQYSENIFDRTNSGQYWINDNTGKIQGNSGARMVYAPVIGNKTYVFKKMRTHRFIVAYTTEVPVAGVEYVTSSYMRDDNACYYKSTAPSNANYICAVICNRSLDDENDALDSVVIFEEKPETLTAISWQNEIGEVYLGSLNVPTGQLTLTHKKMTPVIENRQSENTYGISNWQCILSPKGTTKVNIMRSYSNTFTQDSTSIGSATREGFIPSGGNLYIRLLSTRASTPEAANQFISGLGTYFVYELGTPITYQLTPTEVITILGDSYMLADTGALTTTYRIDNENYIADVVEETQSMITQSIETNMTASKNYSVGDLLIGNNQLLRATAVITSGTTIVIGTSGNVEVVDLATVIKELSARISALE